jgi:hypothetical protein
MNSEKKARAAVVLTCILASAAAVVPFFFMGQPLPGGSRWDLRMPWTHDMFLHYDQMRDFYQGLAAGEVYPRWEEDTNYGFGAPTTCFYPPGVYYLTAAFYPIFHDWTRVLLVAHLLMMGGSAAAIYLLARRYMSRAAAVAAMFAYVVFPYHAIDQYHREALAELLSFIWMPLIMLFADHLLATARRWLPLAGLALSYGGFLWSHPPTAYQFSLVFCPFVLLLAAWRRNWRGLLWTGAGFALGVGLSAAYLLPAAMEQNLIRHEIIGKIWPYHETYLFMYAGYSQRYFDFFQLLNWSWRFEVAVMLGASVAILILTRRLRRIATFWTAIGCWAGFLMLRISAPLGRHIPKIDIGVFSWRMLAITTLIAALLVGLLVQAAIDAGRANRAGRLALFGTLATLALFGGTMFTVFGVMAPVNREDAFQPEEEHTNYAIIPRTAPERTDDLPEVERASLDPPGAVRVRDWKPQHRVIDVSSNAASRLFVRTFNYPGWTATMDGAPLRASTDKETGAMLFSLPAGTHVVALDFLDTPSRRTGARITMVSFLIVLTVLACGALANRQQLRT